MDRTVEGDTNEPPAFPPAGGRMTGPIGGVPPGVTELLLHTHRRGGRGGTPSRVHTRRWPAAPKNVRETRPARGGNESVRDAGTPGMAGVRWIRDRGWTAVV